MNIVYIAQAKSIELNYGTPILADQYSKQALKKNYNVCLITPTYDEKLFYKTLIKNKIYYHHLPAINNWTINGFKYENVASNLNLNLPFKPDLFHIIDLVNFDSQIIYQLSKYKIPIIRHICSFEDFCYFITPIFNKDDHKLCKMQLNADTCSKCISKNFLKNQKFLKKIKFLLLNNQYKIKNEFKKKLKDRNKIINLQLEQNYDHLIFGSKDYADFYFLHTQTKKKFSIIPHGIKTTTPLNKIKKNKINFIYTGGSSLNKGWKVIEDSFEYILKKYSDLICLRIYGDKKKTQKSKIGKFENVEFFERYDHRNITEILNWADVGIIPSYFDTYNLFLRELINYKVIPVCSNFFSASEIIKNNYNGIILENNNKIDLVKSIEKIILNLNFRDDLFKNLSETKIISLENEFEELNKIYKRFKNN